MSKISKVFRISKLFSLPVKTFGIAMKKGWSMVEKKWSYIALINSDSVLGKATIIFIFASSKTITGVAST